MLFPRIITFDNIYKLLIWFFHLKKKNIKKNTFYNIYYQYTNTIGIIVHLLSLSLSVKYSLLLIPVKISLFDSQPWFCWNANMHTNMATHQMIATDHSAQDETPFWGISVTLKYVWSLVMHNRINLYTEYRITLIAYSIV